MSEGSPKFNEGGISNEDEQKKARIEAIHSEIVQIQRQIVHIKIHHKPGYETEISLLEQRQKELLSELKQLKNES